MAAVLLGRSTRKLAVATLFLTAITVFHHTWRRSHPAPTAAARSRLLESGKVLDCDKLCKECALSTDFKTTYDGFPLELTPLPSLPHRFAGARRTAQTEARPLVAISDSCDVFTGTPQSAAPLLWSHVVHTGGHALTQLCAGPPGAATPDAPNRLVCATPECRGNSSLFGQWVAAQLPSYLTPTTVIILVPQTIAFDYSVYARLPAPVVIVPSLLAYDQIISHGIRDSIHGVPPIAEALYREMGRRYATDMVALRDLTLPNDPTAPYNPRCVLVVPTTQMKTSLVQNYYVNQESIATLDVLHVLPPDDERVAVKSKADARGTFNMPDDAFVIGMVYDPTEDVYRQRACMKLLLAALDKAFRIGRTLKVYIIGEPEVLAPVLAPNGVPKAYAEQLQNPSDAAVFFTAIDVLIDVSVVATGSRHSALHALAVGTPAIMPDVGVLTSYTCPACLNYQPGYWNQVIAHLSTLRALQPMQRMEMRDDAIAYANELLAAAATLSAFDGIVASVALEPQHKTE